MTEIDTGAEHRTPFAVAHGPRTVHGQIATGFVVGVRMPDLDVLVFGASLIEQRAMLVREAATS